MLETRVTTPGITVTFLCDKSVCSLASKVKSLITVFLLIYLQAFSYLQSTEKLTKFFHSIVQNVQVFARVAPKQKVMSVCN